MPPETETWTVGRLIEWTRGFFEGRGIDQPRLEAEILLAHVLGCERISLYTGYTDEVGEDARAAYRELVRRRADREPTRYLTGHTEFMSLAMRVTPACLVPRPETELLVETVLALAGRGESGTAVAEGGAFEIIELCTGSGCVAVSLAVHLPAARITATDLSAEALQVARANAEAHGVADRITFLEGDLFEPLDAADAAPAAFLVANPPYVAERAWADLAPEIRDHEPRAALVAGPEGTEVIERVVRGAAAYLAPPAGGLVVEIGADQGPAARTLAEAAPRLGDVEIRKDYAGLDRLLVARRAGARDTEA